MFIATQSDGAISLKDRADMVDAMQLSG